MANSLFLKREKPRRVSDERRLDKEKLQIYGPNICTCDLSIYVNLQLRQSVTMREFRAERYCQIVLEPPTLTEKINIFRRDDPFCKIINSKEGFSNPGGWS